MNIHPFIKEYLLLALRINKIFEGYVDAYYGPPALKTLVENEPVKSAKELIRVCKVLQKDLLEKINDSTRQKYIGAMLNAMEVFLRVLNNEKIEFNEQVEAILGVKPKTFKDDSEFYTLQEEFTQVYYGKGTLAERMEMYKERRRIPVSDIIVKYKRALEITRERTKVLFPDLLPETESVRLEFAKEKVNWSFYNKYLGNFQSIIEINPSESMYWTTFFPFAAHEGYPGHHTELCVKNELLKNQLDWYEHCIILMNSPAGVITEGIAEIAAHMLFRPEERVNIELKEFCFNPDTEDSIENLIGQIQVKHKINRFKIHLANLANIERLSEKELLDYGMFFGFFPKTNLKNLISIILNPRFQIKVYTYNYGVELITKKYGFPPKLVDFRYLLSNPILTSDLV